MRIQSSFRDYYDFIPGRYGGGDPKLPYLRHKFSRLPSLGIRCPETLRQLPLVRDDEIGYWHYKWLAVAGRYYLLVGLGKGAIDWHILDTGRHGQFFDRRCKRTPVRRRPPTVEAVLDNYVGSPGPELVPLSRQLDAPVFAVTPHYRRWMDSDAYLDLNVPVLANLGMPSLISPEQMYQDLEYFMGNVMRVSPDTKPPVTVAERDRIVQHGFDLKTSFRHRQ